MAAAPPLTAPALAVALLAGACSYVPTPPAWGAEAGAPGFPGPIVVDDVGRLYPTPVREVVHTREIAGKRHSQGGHVFYKDAVVLDMTRFNKILQLDKAAKVITVQSGATWEDIQNFANEHGLAVKVQQASNIFTVGGSLSVNAHGRDPGFGPVIESVRSFRILLADGRIVRASRNENRALFSLAIGGYGLFGVILDVELSLTDNDVYENKTVELDYTGYLAFFKREIRGNANVGLHYAWPSIASGGFMRSLLVSTYYAGKDLRWALQRQLGDRPGSSKLISRNNAMRPEVLFLDYDSPTDTDILQEYFVPMERIAPYLDALRQVLQAHAVNLLSATIRYMPGSSEAFLSYAPQDSFSVVLYINQELSAQGRKAAEQWTRRLVDVAHEHGGTYYLPYQLYPTREQLLRAYPAFDGFVEAKRKFDPEEMFVNLFYERYRSPR